MIPKVLALHDMVCLGRCSLTVVIPTLSSMGIKVCPLPTAVLSSDTGGFGPVFSRDLTEEMGKILQKVQALKEGFEAVYSGYLGSPAQAEIVLKAMELFPGLRVVDPVMGDMGRLYQSVDANMVSAMRRLCAGADVITPNLTEACFLTDTEMPKGAVSGEWACALMEKLLQLGCGSAVVTSVHLQKKDSYLVTLVQRRGEAPAALCTKRLQAHFPGTGDLFASVLVGRLLGGMGLEEASGEASAFVARAIEHTLKENAPVREGVLLEALLGELYGKGTLPRAERIEL